MPPENQPQSRVMHAFEVYPSVQFETQMEDEVVVLLLRAHPITQLSWIIATVFLLILPLIFNFFLTSFFDSSQIFFINLFWYSGVFAYAFLNLVSWLFNVGIVTNERVVDVDFRNLIYKEVSASVITKIEDVTVKTGGFIKSIFEYGDLFVQTAGTEENIEFENIPNPTDASAIINNLMKAKDEP